MNGTRLIRAFKSRQGKDSLFFKASDEFDPLVFSLFRNKIRLFFHHFSPNWRSKAVFFRDDVSPWSVGVTKPHSQLQIHLVLSETPGRCGGCTWILWTRPSSVSEFIVSRSHLYRNRREQKVPGTRFWSDFQVEWIRVKYNGEPRISSRPRFQYFPLTRNAHTIAPDVSQKLSRSREWNWSRDQAEVLLEQWTGISLREKEERRNPGFLIIEQLWVPKPSSFHASMHFEVIWIPKEMRVKIKRNRVFIFLWHSRSSSRGEQEKAKELLRPWRSSNFSRGGFCQGSLILRQVMSILGGQLPIQRAGFITSSKWWMLIWKLSSAINHQFITLTDH